jgi:predicted DsbA family dithiol-disulfide isomerase
MSHAQPLRIDFVSDVVCPWCVIGLRSLKQALAALQGEVRAELHLQPFELNPDMPPEGENTAEHLRRKYGSSPERSGEVRRVIRESGERLGFEFVNRPDARIWNTFDAHRLLYWASAQGKALALKEELFRDYFTEGRSMSDPAVLVAAAARAGLDPDLASGLLGSDRLTHEVRVEEQHWRSLGIQAVPSVIFDERWLVQGGQSPEAYEQTIRQVLAAREAEAARTS